MENLLQGVISQILSRRSGIVLFTPRMWILVIALILVRAAAFCYAAWRLPEPRRWKWVLVFEGLQFVVTLVVVFVIAKMLSFWWLRFSTTYANGPLMLAVLTVIVIDLARGIRRDWLHWLGALLPLLQFLLSIALRALASFLPVNL